MKKQATRVPFSTILSSFGILILVMVCLLLATLPLQSLTTHMGTEFAQLCFQLFGFGLVILLLALIASRKKYAALITYQPSQLRTYVLTMVVAVALLFGIVNPISSMIPMPEEVKELFLKTMSQTSVFSFVLLVIAAPLTEEVVFKRYMLTGLLSRYSPVIAILLSSFWFGIMHMNPWQFVTGVVLGTFAGWIYYRTQNIWLPICAHATTNLSAYAMRLYLQDKITRDMNMIDSVGGVTNLIILSLISLTIVVMGLLYLNQYLKAPTNDVGSSKTC
jgi:membrane protease YdiL (CAAX protease family)